MEPTDDVLPTRRYDRGKLIRGTIVIGGALLIFLGIAGSVTGRDQSNLPDEIERIEPSKGDKVLNQANLVVDLVPGYTGELIIDGVLLPTVSTQVGEPTGPAATDVTASSVAAPTPVSPDDLNVVRFDAGTNTLSFQPRPGGDLERFAAGQHFVTVRYWKIIEGPQNDFTYGWGFEVTA